MRPKKLVEKWVTLFNEGDADKIAELYHEDAVNHQVANEPVNGKEEIPSKEIIPFESWQIIVR